MRAGCSFTFTLSGDLSSRIGAVDACIRAFLSPAWSRPLRYLLMQTVGGTGFPRKRGRIALKERALALSELLVHPDLRSVSLSTTGKGFYGDLEINTRVLPWSSPHLLCKAQQSFDVEMLERGDSWVMDMLELAGALDVRHGIVTLMNDLGTSSEISFCGMFRDGVNQHPFPDQFERMSKAVSLRELGTRYVRFPRWGTIYSKAHVEQLGGAERIREVVRPALIRELGGDAFYVQLTDSIVTAASDEAMRKQQAFTELAEPLLPPRREGASSHEIVADAKLQTVEPSIATTSPGFEPTTPAVRASEVTAIDDTRTGDSKPSETRSGQTESGRTRSGRKRPKPFF